MKTLVSFHKALSVFTRTYSYLRLAREGFDQEALRGAWARETLQSMDIETHIRGQIAMEGPLLLVGNHVSYLDIPFLMLACSKVSFLAKSEVGRWPIIGDGARAMDTIFVERDSGTQRASAKAAVIRGLQQGRRIVLFPSGTTSLDESKVWRRGAFEIAQTQGVRIQPFRIRYLPLRRSAYIDRDIFPVHLFRLAQGGKVTATLEFHPPQWVEDIASSCQKWQNWAQEGISADLY